MMRGIARACLLLTVALLVAGGGCSAGGGGAYDGGVPDGVYEVSLDLPPGCPPAAGNEAGVGAPCTMGGHECSHGTTCACDKTLGIQLKGVPCICTKFQIAQTADPCGPPLPSTFCGSGAKCCPYLTAAAYCVPDICLPGGMCPDPTAP
jgi:hypothetical protein